MMVGAGAVEGRELVNLRVIRRLRPKESKGQPHQCEGGGYEVQVIFAIRNSSLKIIHRCTSYDNANVCIVISGSLLNVFLGLS